MQMHGENMQTQHRKAPAEILTRNPLAMTLLNLEHLSILLKTYW